MRLHFLISKSRRLIPAIPVWFCFMGMSVADAQQPPRILFADIQEAVSKQQIGQSKMLGFSIVNKPFTDIPPQGGVLIGFDLQLGKFFDHETIHALQPIYLTEKGELVTHEFGEFARSSKKKKSDLTRLLRIKAPEGFAVGCITVRHGLYLDGLKFTFQRIQGRTLDTQREAVSDWIGNNQHGHSVHTIGGNGQLIVGIHGHQDQRRVLGLGIFQLLQPDLAAVPLQPRPQQAEPPPIDQAAEPLRQLRFAEDQNDLPDHDPAPANKDAPGRVEAIPARVQEQPRSTWLPYGVFGIVSMVVFAGCWFVMSNHKNKERTAATRRPEKKPKQSRRKGPPPIPREMLEDAEEVSLAPPTPTCAQPHATAICEKSSLPWNTPREALSNQLPTPPVPVSHDKAAQIDTLESLPELPSVARSQPAYFFARAVYTLRPNQLFRVYVLPEMLLLLEAGPENHAQFTQSMGAVGAGAGGILGGVIGATIGGIIDENRGDIHKARKRLLDNADTQELIQLAGAGAPSFRAIIEDLHEVRLEPTSVWHSMQYLGQEYVGLLLFRHAEMGEFILEIPTLHDMKTVLTELPRVLGDVLTVNVVLDRCSWQYVRKPV